MSERQLLYRQILRDEDATISAINISGTLTDFWPSPVVLHRGEALHIENTPRGVELYRAGLEKEGET